MVWLSWKVSTEENVAYLPHKNEVLGVYVIAEQEFICIVFSTGYKRT